MDMKSVNIVQARAFKGLDNPKNTAVFIKYYLKGEFNAIHGVVIPNSWITEVRHNMSQFANEEKYNKKMVVKTPDDKHTFMITYGIAKDMTCQKFFHHFAQWAGKVKPVESAEFTEIKDKVSKKQMTLTELLNDTNNNLFRQFIVIS